MSEFIRLGKNGNFSSIEAKAGAKKIAVDNRMLVKTVNLICCSIPFTVVDGVNYMGLMVPLSDKVHYSWLL